MSDIELGSVISLIMENPELIAEIKRLAEAKSSEGENVSSSQEAEVPTMAEAPVIGSNKNGRKSEEKVTNDKGRRSELLRALSPYISEGRQKALETFMTIADILDMMREK